MEQPGLEPLGESVSSLYRGHGKLGTGEFLSGVSVSKEKKGASG